MKSNELRNSFQRLPSVVLNYRQFIDWLQIIFEILRSWNNEKEIPEAECERTRNKRIFTRHCHVFKNCCNEKSNWIFPVERKPLVENLEWRKKQSQRLNYYLLKFSKFISKTVAIQTHHCPHRKQSTWNRRLVLGKRYTRA